MKNYPPSPVIKYKTLSKEQHLILEIRIYSYIQATY